MTCRPHQGKSALGLALAAILSTVTLIKVQAQETQPGTAAMARKIGSVKSITGATLVLKPDAGAEVTVTVQDSARIVRLGERQTDLKSSFSKDAATIVVMKQA